MGRAISVGRYGRLGRGAAGLTCATTNHCTCSGCSPKLLPLPATGVTLGDEIIGTACRSRASTTASVTTIGLTSRSRSGPSNGSSRPAARRTRSRSTATRTSGGCRMGTAPENSVIDRDHRVWGVPNLVHRRRLRHANTGGREPRAHDHGARGAPGRSHRLELAGADVCPPRSRRSPAQSIDPRAALPL